MFLMLTKPSGNYLKNFILNFMIIFLFTKNLFLSYMCLHTYMHINMHELIHFLTLVCLCFILRALPVNIMFVRFIYIVAYTCGSFIFLLHIIPLFEYTLIYLSVLHFEPLLCFCYSKQCFLIAIHLTVHLDHVCDMLK